MSVCTYVFMYVFMYVSTVRAFNSYTSRPDISLCLVVQTNIDNMSISKPGTSLANVAN